MTRQDTQQIPSHCALPCQPTRSLPLTSILTRSFSVGSKMSQLLLPLRVNSFKSFQSLTPLSTSFSRQSLLNHRFPSPRLFSSTSANMAIKAWFDVEWTDPQLDRQRTEAARSGGAVPPREFPLILLNSAHSLPWSLSRLLQSCHGILPPAASISHLPLPLLTLIFNSQERSYQLHPLRRGRPQDRRELPCPLHW